MVVVYDAKIRIIKQITTNEEDAQNYCGCCLWCKDKNNKANHNPTAYIDFFPLVVVYDAKIRIIKQITTKRGMGDRLRMLLFMMQR